MARVLKKKSKSKSKPKSKATSKSKSKSKSKLKAPTPTPDGVISASGMYSFKVQTKDGQTIEMNVPQSTPMDAIRSFIKNGV